MGDSFALRLWAGRGLYLALAAILVFARLLPLDSTPDRFPAPDVLLCITYAWVLRRPEQVPPWLVAGLFLLLDFLFFRPPGLWAVLVLAGSEVLRGRALPGHDLPFPLEWLTVAVVMLGAAFAEHALLAVFLVPGPALGIALWHILVTILVYPLVAGGLRIGFGLRRAAPGEADALGGRL